MFSPFKLGKALRLPARAHCRRLSTRLTRKPATCPPQRKLGSVSTLVEQQREGTGAKHGAVWGTALAGIFSVMGVSSVSLLDSAAVVHEPMQDNDSPDNHEENKEEEDPYANLPEEDEPTECSMCNNFRQGPCRPFWRKLERCMKDNENTEGGIQSCMRYFYPHQKCLMKYINLYDLIRVTSLQQYIDETEESLPVNQRQSLDMPLIDWGLWDEFQKDAGIMFSQGISSSEKRSPLWQRFPPNTEPVVLTFSTSIPRVEESSGMLLRFAYVVDQDGMVLGVESNGLYRRLKDKADGREIEEDKNGDNEDKEKEQPGPNLSLSFLIIPSITKKIQVKALYAKDPTTPGIIDDGRDDRLKATSFIKVGGGKA